MQQEKELVDGSNQSLTCKTNISEQRQLVFGLYRLQTEKEKSAKIVGLSFEGMSVCAESRITESNL